MLQVASLASLVLTLQFHGVQAYWVIVHGAARNLNFDLLLRRQYLVFQTWKSYSGLESIACDWGHLTRVCRHGCLRVVGMILALDGLVHVGSRTTASRMHGDVQGVTIVER